MSRLYPSTSDSSLIVEAAITVFLFLIVVGPVVAYFSPDPETEKEES